MSPRWKWNLVGHLWALPLTLIGLVLFKYVYRAHSWRWHQGVLCCIGGAKIGPTARGPQDGVTRIWGRPGAQTVGTTVCFADEHQFSRADLRVHEFVHCAQAMVGGVLFGIAYGLVFLYQWAASGFGPWHAAYRANVFEAHAYRIGDQAKGWGA